MADAEVNEAVIPHRKISIDFFVGLFVFIGLICFAYLAINLAKMRIFGTGYYEVKALFNNISGLKEGASVEIAGVPVGSVDKVQLDGTSALVTLSIKDIVKLREDDIASIRTKGIIGDRYVRITPGGSDVNISGGGEITDTESVVDLEEVIGKFIHNMK